MKLLPRIRARRPKPTVKVATPRVVRLLAFAVLVLTVMVAVAGIFLVDQNAKTNQALREGRANRIAAQNQLARTQQRLEQEINDLVRCILDARQPGDTRACLTDQLNRTAMPGSTPAQPSQTPIPAPSSPSGRPRSTPNAPSASTRPSTGAGAPGRRSAPSSARRTAQAGAPRPSRSRAPAPTSPTRSSTAPAPRGGILSGIKVCLPGLLGGKPSCVIDN